MSHHELIYKTSEHLYDIMYICREELRDPERELNEAVELYLRKAAEARAAVA